MSEQISDITTEHLGPDATEEEADLALLWLLTHGYEGNAEIGDVTEADWQDAVEWALRHGGYGDLGHDGVHGIIYRRYA